MNLWAIMPAAGVGRRMEMTTPKQYMLIKGQPLISLSLGKLLAIDSCQKVVVAVQDGDTRWQSLQMAQHPRIETARGGATRQESVLSALDALAADAADGDWVLVHDAVRPCVPVTDIELLLSSLAEDECGGLLGARVDSTLKRLDGEQRILQTVDREHYWQALTPQLFRYGKLVAALRSAAEQGVAVTDESAAMEWAGHAPRVIEGSKLNIKITHAVDLLLAEAILVQSGDLK